VYRTSVQWVSADQWRGRRVLVTGASGFIGAVVSRLLLNAEAEVHGTGHTQKPPQEVTGHRAQFPQDTERLFDEVQPDVVFHLASPIMLGSETALLDTMRSGIVDASIRIAQACAHHGARLVHVGSCAEYGECEAPHSETDVCKPKDPYGILKLEATHAVLERTSQQAITVVRPFRTIGPGEHRGVVAAACRAALNNQPFPMTDGAQIREWNHVEAISTGIICAGSHPNATGKIINIGGGQKQRVLEMVRTIYTLAGADPARILNGSLERRTHEVEHFWGDHSHSESLWGPLPQPPLHDTLAACLQWFNTTPERAI
jgi:nucleoside-diphosphate-sugar epimerase